MKTLSVLATALLLTFAFALTVQARTSSQNNTSQANASQEISTAHAHALMAQNAGSLNMAHTHLHHVINCLEGSNGEDFDASAGNPCNGQGNGALPDSQGNSGLHEKLKAALSEAKSGLESDSLDSVHSDASTAASALQQASSSQSASGPYGS